MSDEGAPFLSQTRHINIRRQKTVERNDIIMRHKKWRYGVKVFSSLLILLILMNTGGAVATGRMLIPVGHTIGVKLYSKGVLIVGMEDVYGSKTCCPAKESGLKEGDLITRVDSKLVTSTEMFWSYMQNAGEKDMSIIYTRSGNEKTTSVKAIKTKEGYKIGAWIRDSIAGIGTMTFYDPETGVFAALGHGINDVDTDLLMPLGHGSIMHSTVLTVRHGKEGEPGELQGAFDLKKDMGNLISNTDHGIFGSLSDKSLIVGKPVEISSDVKLGKAVILSNVTGNDVMQYDIEIVNIYSGENNKDYMIKVTDEELLMLTGGIVQGMSGSPILQDGKLVGAVTHVLINDPTKGYAISIEKMLSDDFSCENAA